MTKKQKYDRARYEENREAVKARTKDYYNANKSDISAKKRADHLLRTYGLTTEQYDQLLEDQDWKCPICERPLVKTHVDHCHDTGVVRGILCPGCNVALGIFQDSPEILIRAADYVTLRGTL